MTSDALCLSCWHPEWTHYEHRGKRACGFARRLPDGTHTPWCRCRGFLDCDVHFPDEDGRCMWCRAPLQLG